MIDALLFCLPSIAIVPIAVIARIAWDCSKVNGGFANIPRGLIAERVRVMFGVPLETLRLYDADAYFQVLPYVGTWSEK